MIDEGERDRSSTEALARALLLVETHLVEAATRELTPAQSIAIRLCSLGVPDDRLARRSAEELCAQPPPLTDNLRWLWELMFVRRGGLSCLRPDPLARRLARVVDPDALVCMNAQSLPSAERFDWGPWSVVDEAAVSEVLREESIDTHVHLGGILPPLFYWVALMTGEFPLESLRGFAARSRGHARAEDWQRGVAGAMWLRIGLADWLGSSSTLGECPDGIAAIRDTVLARSASARRQRLLADNRAAPPFTDPLGSGDAGQRQHYAEVERRLLYRLGERLRRDDAKDIEGQIVAYLRVRNAFHEIMVHDYGSDGLQRFTEAFHRRGFVYQGRRARRHRRFLLQLEHARMKAALDEQLADPDTGPPVGVHQQPLRRIEVRVSVPGKYPLRVLRAWLLGIRGHLGPHGTAVRRSQVGLVFHLIKTGRDKNAEHRAWEAARRLGGVLRDYPALRPFIVGLDAAGEERASPPRVFAKAYRHLKELEKRHRTTAGTPRIRLGRTFHVGEDVDDLMSALRHIDEVAALLLGEEGGRLGHALALGEDPARYYQRRGGETAPSLGSHLLDLVWAWGGLADARLPDHCPWLENRVVKLGGRADRLERCYRSMAEPAAYSEVDLLSKLGFEGNAGEPAVCRADKRWLALVGEMQRLLRRRLEKQRICIEANPTSNLLIGGYAAYEELPYEKLVAEGLSLSLNTDDPGLFATSLAGEYAAMYSALSEGMGHRERLSWLSDRAFDARQSSFLGLHVPAGADAVDLLNHLDRLFAFAP